MNICIYFPQQFLYFKLEPHEQGSFRPNLVVLIQGFCGSTFILSPLIPLVNQKITLLFLSTFHQGTKLHLSYQ